MAVVVTRSRAWGERSNRAQLYSLMRTLSGAGLVLLAGISAWLFVRRLTGALAEPLSPLLLLATGAASIGFAALLRVAWFSATNVRRTNDRARIIALAIPTISLVLIAGALSLPESSTWAVVGLWGIVVAGECGVWFEAFRHTRMRRDGWQETGSHRGSWLARWARGRRERVRQVALRALEPNAARNEDSLEEELLAPDVSHKLARRHTTAGNEIVEGLWRVPFAPGERATSVHIAFCPPLDTEPKVIVDQLEGPAASVKIGQLQTFGLRLDVRLSSAAEQATDLVLHVEAATTVAAAAPAH